MWNVDQNRWLMMPSNGRVIKSILLLELSPPERNSIFKLWIKADSNRNEFNRFCDRILISNASALFYHQFCVSILLSLASRITFEIPKTITQLMCTTADCTQHTHTHTFLCQIFFTLTCTMHMSIMLRLRVFELLNADEQICVVERTGKNEMYFSFTFIIPTLENTNTLQRTKKKRRWNNEKEWNQNLTGIFTNFQNYFGEMEFMFVFTLKMWPIVELDWIACVPLLTQRTHLSNDLPIDGRGNMNFKLSLRISLNSTCFDVKVLQRNISLTRKKKQKLMFS